MRTQEAKETDMAKPKLGSLSVERHRRAAHLAMPACAEIHQKSRNDDERTEEKPIHPQHGFVVTFHHRQAEQQQRKHSRENRTSQTARNAEFTLQLRLSEAQRHQG